MPDVLVEYVAQFSVFCAVHYSTITVATALVALIMAAVLLLIRQEALKEEGWILYLGLAFGTFFLQYGLRAFAAWVRGGNYSTPLARFIDLLAQSLFSNLNSLFFLLAALALLYRLPNRWWRTGWIGLVGVFLLSAILGVTLPAPWDRYVDATLSAVCLSILSWAMFVSSGTRQRRGWARLNLLGGGGYAALHVVYAYVPTFAQWPRIAEALAAELKKYGPDPTVLPNAETALDAGIFAFAFAFKVTLFIGALLVVMRCLSAFSPSVSRAVLEPVKTGRGEFLAATGIVRAMGESIGADAAALYFRLPGTKRNEVSSLNWICGQTQSDSNEPGKFRCPLPTESALGLTLASEDILWSRDRRKDKRFPLDEPRDGEDEMRSFVNVPLLYHGAVVGSLNFDWKRKPFALTATFTATDVQRVRQIADFVTPVVQTERWLRAVVDLRGRLQHYNFDPAALAAGTFIARVGGELHDVLAPRGTLVTVDFGFNAQWVLCGPETRSSDDHGETRGIHEIEAHFRRSFGVEVEYVVTPLTLRDHSDEEGAADNRVQIGKIIFAVRRGSDSIDSPSLTQDRQQLQMIAELIKDVVLDLHRKRFSGIVHRLHNELDGRGFASEEYWAGALRLAGTEAGLLQVNVLHHDSTLSLRAEPSEDISSQDVDMVAPAEHHSAYRIYVAHPEQAASPAMIEIPLPSSGETLLLATARATFGRELRGDRDLAWKLFLDRFADAADSSLVRIRAVELERSAMKFEMHSLLVHELRNQAVIFQAGVEVTLDPRLPELSRLRLLEGLRVSAGKFVELADALKPASADGRSEVPLFEIRDRIDRFYESRLAARAIELQWSIHDNDVIPVPLDLAYLVLVSLMQNASDAIEGSSGRIHVHSERSPDSILLHVDDTGCGVRADQREQIFRLEFSTKTGGSGIGLPLARRLLQHYRADLQLAEHAPEHMSTRFTIRFSKELS